MSNKNNLSPFCIVFFILLLAGLIAWALASDTKDNYSVEDWDVESEEMTDVEMLEAKLSFLMGEMFKDDIALECRYDQRFVFGEQSIFHGYRYMVYSPSVEWYEMCAPYLDKTCTTVVENGVEMEESCKIKWGID